MRQYFDTCLELSLLPEDTLLISEACSFNIQIDTTFYVRPWRLLARSRFRAYVDYKRRQFQTSCDGLIIHGQADELFSDCSDSIPKGL